MQTESTKDDPRQIIRDVAKIVGEQFRADYEGLTRAANTCYGIACDDPAEVIEEAVTNGLSGARIAFGFTRHVVYWPNVTDSSPCPLRD